MRARLAKSLPAGSGPSVVEAVVAPQVVGLPRRDAVLNHVGRHGGVVADGERHELLLTPAAHQLEQVAAREPVLGDADRHGGLPRAADRARAGGDHRSGLGTRRDEVALPGEAATEALVVAHPVRLHLHGPRPRVDEQGHVVAGDRADLAGEPLERVVGLDEVADPVERARLGVLGDEPGCGRHHDAARELGVDDRGERHGRVASGARRHAVLRALGAQARPGQPGGTERGHLQELASVQAGAIRGGRDRRGVGAAVRGEGPHEASLSDSPRCTPWHPVAGRLRHHLPFRGELGPLPPRTVAPTAVPARARGVGRRRRARRDRARRPLGQALRADGPGGVPAVPPGRPLQRAPRPHRRTRPSSAPARRSQRAWHPARRCRRTPSCRSAAAA